MKTIRQIRNQSLAALAVACSMGAAAGMFSSSVGATPDGATTTAQTNFHAKSANRVQLDRSGHRQVGKASFYANRYSGRTMADGTPMHLYSNNAASLTLPLGTTARVTNVETGKSAVVTIQDRGPYVKGRIVDLSPATAEKIGIDRRQGLAKVIVTPLSIPQPDGTVKLLRGNI